MLKHYRLSRLAEDDLAAIFNYSIEKFGLTQAQDYLFLLEEHLNFLVQNPYVGRVRRVNNTRLQSLVCQSHVVYYQVRTDYIFIIRILHQSRDSEAHL